jgi:hypothetical protein
VRVTVREGSIFEGVLHTTSTNKGGFGVILKQARKVTDDTPLNAPYTSK